MTRWALGSKVTISDDEDGKYDYIGVCLNCNHQGMMGTYCPGCEDTGSVHGIRQSPSCVASKSPNDNTKYVGTSVDALSAVSESRQSRKRAPGGGTSVLGSPGDERKDVEQECVVTKQSATRVQVSFRDKNGCQAMKLKHPALLVLLEEGLHIVQDARGCGWVKPDGLA